MTPVPEHGDRRWSHAAMAFDAGTDVPGYPADLERRAVLADCREVFIRPIRPGDAAELRRALATADYETLHARFLGSPPHQEASIRRLVEVDYANRLALVAVAPDGTGVGVARYEREMGGSTAEVAVAVHAGWRRVGLGSLLLRDLGEVALRQGICRFTALVLADNAPVLALLRASGLAFTVEIQSGTSNIVMTIEAQEPPPAGND
jgi:acetyltransferase